MALVSVPVLRMNGATEGVFELPTHETLIALKQAIEAAGGPEKCDQQFVGKGRVLPDGGSVEEALAEGGGQLLLVVVKACASCRGPCECRLCGATKNKLFDYYGRCGACAKCGGHAEKCKLCRQSFPSLCALDCHMRWMHPEEFKAGDHEERFKEHVENGSIAPYPEANTFKEACRGGCAPGEEAVQLENPWAQR